MRDLTFEIFGTPDRKVNITSLLFAKRKQIEGSAQEICKKCPQKRMAIKGNRAERVAEVQETVTKVNLSKKNILNG